MKYFIFIILLLTSCASASPTPESERAEPERTRPANTEAQLEEDMTMVCETSPDPDLKAEDFIAFSKEQAQTQKALLVTSCTSESLPAESDAEALFEEDMTMVCETSHDLELKAEDYIALWKEQAQTQKLKALIGDDRESAVWLRDRLHAERGNTCTVLAYWDSILSPGRLSGETVRTVLFSHSTEFEKCYMDFLESGDRRRQKIVMSFTVGEDGKTKDVSGQQFVSVDGDYIENDTVPLVDCVVEVHKQMQFPEPEGGEASIVYGFFFRP